MNDALAFTAGACHPSARMRIEAYAARFAQAGWRLKLHPFDPGMGKSVPRAETWFKRARHRLHRRLSEFRAASALRELGACQPVIISREVPVNPRPFLKSPHPLILDVDDALYLGPDRRDFDRLCQRAQLVVCGNQTIADNLSASVRKRIIIPTAVETDSYTMRSDYKAASILRVGWLGSSMSIEQTLRPLAEILCSIQSEAKFELVVISDEPPHFLRHIQCATFVQWSPSVEQSISAHCDVGIMPLQDTPYQAAKCGAKLLQYMAGGLPVIATPVGANRDIVLDGLTGYWATTPQEWRHAIQRLAGDEPLRASMGQAGREHVVKRYSIARWVHEWVKALNDLRPQDPQLISECQPQ